MTTQSKIHYISKQYGLNSYNATNHAFYESAFNHKAHRKNSRYYGLYQIDTSCYKQFTPNPTFSEQEQIHTYCKIMRYYLDKRCLNYEQAILAFGMGEKGMKRNYEVNKKKFSKYLKFDEQTKAERSKKTS